ncbi:scopoletin glucosyltransferase-like [Dorcoceras hygrometricum]|uniref:Glycosyltransferase n=1 Tax=Dorcoceras hygrometricum TaxID=472368 RepID=A0A2Z7C9Q2_9LAMI|nr:scopoletin glucosyltransferase-like [Dorcoceras hygrometricum]
MGQLVVVFLPFLAHGHMIPMLDMAKLFHSRGVKIIIISTAEFAGPIKKAQESGHDIGLSILKFPPEGSDLPEGCVSFDHIMGNDDLLTKFIKAVSMLREPVEKLLEEFRPNCLVSDMFLPWSTDSAAKFGIPRLVFHGFSTFALCATEQMKRHKPYANVSSDSEPFSLPNLPHKLQLVRTQMNPVDLEEKETAFSQLRVQMREAEGRSYGVVVNSFYELEPDYADHYKNVLGRRAWHIGPLLLHNKDDLSAKALRGKESVIDEHDCVEWLDSKKPNSVVYVCFGSMASFTSAQLRETAIGLEASGQDFIWVVRRGENGQGNDGFLPDGYEERIKGKGLIIRGWAPQVLILNHPSIGAFVTHCGWNSTLEGVCAGVPMVTWPVFAEQFFNEKLVTEVLRTGVSVGNRQWRRSGSEGVPSKAVAKAVQSVIDGKEAPEMRNRAKKLKEMALKAVEEGGSSCKELSSLIEELSVYRPSSTQA